MTPLSFTHDCTEDSGVENRLLRQGRGRGLGELPGCLSISVG